MNAIAGEGRRYAVIRKHEVEDRFPMFRKDFDVGYTGKYLSNNPDRFFSTPLLHCLRVKVMKWPLEAGRVSLDEMDFGDILHREKTSGLVIGIFVFQAPDPSLSH